MTEKLLTGMVKYHHKQNYYVSLFLYYFQETKEKIKERKLPLVIDAVSICQSPVP